MYTLTEEQRKQLLQYMWARPYGEVANNIAMLASLKAVETKTGDKDTLTLTPDMEVKDDKSKKDLS